MSTARIGCKGVEPTVAHHDGGRTSGEDTGMAVECAASAARRYVISRQAFRSGVVGVTRQLQKYRRAAFTISTRRISLRTEPTRMSPGESLNAVPHPEDHDPWAVDAASLERETLVCTSCPDCGESTDAGCPTCGGSGTVHAWLALDECRTTRVVVGFKYIAGRVHPNVASIDDFDCEVFPARLEDDTGWTETIDDVPTELEPELDPRCERIDRVRIQTFVAPIYSVTYRLPQGRATIEIAGLSARVLPWSNFNPLKLRLVVYVASLVIAVLAGAIVRLELPMGRSILVALGVAAAEWALLRSPAVWSVIKHSFPRKLGGMRFERRIRSVGLAGTAPTH
jgi:hypothetical protein